MKRTIKKVIAILSITLMLSFTTTESQAGFWKSLLEFFDGPGIHNRPPNPLVHGW